MKFHIVKRVDETWNAVTGRAYILSHGCFYKGWTDRWQRWKLKHFVDLFLILRTIEVA